MGPADEGRIAKLFAPLFVARFGAVTLPVNEALPLLVTTNLPIPTFKCGPMRLEIAAPVPL